MFLSDDACLDAAGLVQQPRQALDAIKGLEVVDSGVQTVHAILMLRQARQDGRPAGGAAAYAGEGVLQDQAALRQGVQVGCLADLVAVSARLHAVVIGNQKQHISLLQIVRNGRWLWQG